MAKWITEGAKAEKIVIGIPAYGRTYELTFPNNLNNPGAPINGSRNSYTFKSNFRLKKKFLIYL